MKRLMNFKQLFEYRTGPKKKTIWTENDVIITLYYYKFGNFRNLGIQDSEIESFVNEYIGSNKDSLDMQVSNINFILTGYGLPRHSKLQQEVVEKYGKLTEPELREIVESIIENMSDDEKLENLITAEERDLDKKKRKEEKLNKKSDKKREYTKRVKSEEEDIVVDRFGKVIPKLKDIESKDEVFVKVGDVLNHKKFGKGEVVEADGNIIKIDFFSDDNEPKKFIFNPEHYNWSPYSYE